MAFNFFGFKKKQDIEDVEVKVQAPQTTPDVLAEQKSEPPLQAVDESIKEEAPPDNESSTLKPMAQMETLKATREDVIAAYKIFLGRLPESMEVVDPRVGVNSSAILVDFLISKEFLDQAPRSQLILGLAKKILDERKQNTTPEMATSQSTSETNTQTPQN